MANTVLITGSSSGFGKAAALQFRRAGWNVVATMRDPARWDAARWDPAALSDNVLVLPLDVRDTNSIQSAVAHASEHFGRIDCVVNNAGAGLFSVFEATPMEAVRALFETNLFGMMQVSQAVLPYFRQQGGGRLVNVASGSGIVPEPLMTVYSATKFAVEGFSEALSHELAAQHVVVKVVEPGLVRQTNFIQHTIETSTVASVPPAYQPLVDQAMAMYMNPPAFELGTEADVAAAIFAAASDDTDQLRYVVGGDTEMSAHMRRETSEDAYRAWTLSRYAAQAHA